MKHIEAAKARKVLETKAENLSHASLAFLGTQEYSLKGKTEAGSIMRAYSTDILKKALYDNSLSSCDEYELLFPKWKEFVDELLQNEISYLIVESSH